MADLAGTGQAYACLSRKSSPRAQSNHGVVVTTGNSIALSMPGAWNTR
jgi:hypothetical protein